MDIFRQNPDVIIRYEGDKALAFHQGTGWICIMNPASHPDNGDPRVLHV